MRVGLISTYPPIECGIATYTQYLTEALRENHADVYIVSHMGGTGLQVFPSFDYEDGDLADKAFSTMIRFTPDVVHIQHEFGLFGKYNGVSIIPLIMQFRMAGIPVVTTLHTVYSEIPEKHRIIYQEILCNSNRVIVHESYQLETLQNQFKSDLVDKIRVIPHGAREVQNTIDAKNRLGLPADKKIILLIGYFRPSKNFELLVDVLPEILKQFPKAILVIAGKTRGREFLDYRNMLYDRIATSPVREHIYLIRGQLPQNIFDTIISAADTVALPYKINSQSGIMAHCLAFGKPLIASNSEAMKQILSESGAGLVFKESSECVEKIVGILSDDVLSKKLSQNAKAYVQNEISWSKIARLHLDTYKEIMEVPNIISHVVLVE
jgi:glycosyltransferase involved in cell wall biosynthesis